VAGVHIEIDDRELKEALGKLISKCGDASLALRDIGEYLLLSHDKRWDREVSPDGVPWAELSPVTLARKQKLRPGAPMGKLVFREYLRHLHYQVTGNSLELGTDRVYGAAQQFGMPRGYAGRGRYRTRKGSFPIPWGDIPARPFLGVSEEDRGEILDILGRYLAGS
jgi:phage virion morphogenesis protein